MTHVMIWIIIIITYCLYFCRTPTCSSGAPVHGAAHQHRARSPSSCWQWSRTWTWPGVFMVTALPRPHAEHTLPQYGFANLGCFQPKSNSYKNIVLIIITTVKISLLTPKPEMILMLTQSCRVPRAVQTPWERSSSCRTELQRVFSSDDAVFRLLHHSSQCNVIFHSNKTWLECEKSLLFLSILGKKGCGVCASPNGKDWRKKSSDPSEIFQREATALPHLF